MPSLPDQRRTLLRVWRYGPLIIWLAFIFFASSAEFSADNTSRIIGPLFRWLFPNITEETLAAVHFGVRKLAHFSEYGVLALLAARAFSSSSQRILRTNWFLSSVALVVVYALLDEFHQSFVPSRTPSIFDSLIDALGGLTLLLIFAFWKRRRKIATNNDFSRI